MDGFESGCIPAHRNTDRGVAKNIASKSIVSECIYLWVSPSFAVTVPVPVQWHDIRVVETSQKQTTPIVLTIVFRRD